MNNIMGVTKGLFAGVVAGAIAGFVGTQMIRSNKNLKKKANKAVGAMEDLLDNVNYMFK